MGCFSFLKQDDQQPSALEEADLVLKSLEVMRNSQRVAVFPGLRWIHAPGSMHFRKSAQQQNVAEFCSLLSDGSRIRRISRWEPLHVLVEKGKFKGKPLPLPSPPRSEEDEDCLVPPLVPRTSARISSMPISSDVWGIKLKCFSFEELSLACQDFSSRCCIREGNFGKVYKCLMYVRDGRNIGKKKVEVAVLRLNEGPEDLEAWIGKVKWIARLQNSNVCKLIGFCSSNPHKDTRIERLLVFEHCDYGGLDVLLSKSQYIRPLDWSTRVNIAVGAAKGLAYLHEKAFFQAVYTNLTISNVLIDKNFNAKLSDYGLCFEAHSSHKSPQSTTSLASESFDTYLRSDVGSFGMILLELLVGSKNMRRLISKKGDSARWIPRLLRDESKLHTIVDSELRSEANVKSMKRLASVALRCLRKESHLRPSMRDVVAQLEPLKLGLDDSTKAEEQPRQVLTCMDMNRFEARHQ